MTFEPGKKVVVAMSGGVDSSVAALLLKQQHYDVVGVMLRLWSEDACEGKNACCTPSAVAGARRVAALLDIPFYVMDAKDIFFDQVVQYFLRSYTTGETPNPCIVCNQEIRWGYLSSLCNQLGAEYLATGHYARIRVAEDFTRQLLKAVDDNKDQTYMLCRLNQKQLSSTIFPLGEMKKPQVREIARINALPVAEKEESQDLCFVGNLNYREFLQKYSTTPIVPGEIVDLEGKVIGRHAGLAYYTIGQRKGLNLALGSPAYVVGKNIAKNQLVVGETQQRYSSDFIASDFHWISGQELTQSIHVQVKVRYRSMQTSAVLEPLNKGGVHVILDIPQADITPGQQIVAYLGDVCLGGGKIVSIGESI